MLKLKRLACAALSAVMLLTAAATAGCSTPKVAMTVDGTEYSSGDYLAYLYMVYYNVFYNGYKGNTPLFYYAYSQQDPWDVELTYGEGDAAVSLKAAD